MSDVRFHLLAWALFSALSTTAVIAAEDALDDPTRPSNVTPETRARAPRAPSWHVESILVSAGRKLAVINGRLVSVNDRVSGARVVEILPYEVTIEYQGRIRRVALVPERVKHPAD